MKASISKHQSTKTTKSGRFFLHLRGVLFSPLGVGGLWLLWLTAPYLAACFLGHNHQWVFAGFLFNPEDNFSYLAKMWQGYQGKWCYQSAYTILPHKCLPAFLYYLLLGHIARVTGMPILVTYHVARLINGILVFMVLFSGMRRVFSHPATQIFGLLLTLFGAGLGWLYLPVWLPRLPPDFNVADAFLYLSAIDNPHFLLIHALNLFFLFYYEDFFASSQRWLSLWSFAITLSLLSPFSVVLWSLVLFAHAITLRHWGLIKNSLGFAFAGALYPTLLQIIIHHDATWQSWDHQNVTLSPPFWSILLSFSLLLFLALYGLFVQHKKYQPWPSVKRLALLYFVSGICLAYIPFTLQRRFLISSYPMAAILGTFSIEQIAQISPYATKRFKFVTLSLSLPVLLLTVLGYAFLLTHQSSVFYLYPGEQSAFEWISNHLPQEAAVFISSPSTGSRLAAFTGRKVIVGHYMETPSFDAQENKAYAAICEGQQPQWKSSHLYIFAGPREQNFCEGHVNLSLQPIYINEGVSIYQVTSQTETKR